MPQNSPSDRRESPGVRFRRRAAKAAQLRAADWRLLAESFATLLLVGTGLRILPFPRLLAWTTHVSDAPAALSSAEIDRLTWLVGITTRVTWFKCLVRSMTLSRVLGRRGVATALQIGVRPDAADLAAHAWVEWNGRVLNDTLRHVREYVPLDRPARLNAHV